MNALFLTGLSLSLILGLLYTTIDSSESAVGIAFFASVLSAFAMMIYFNSKTDKNQ